MQKLSSFQVQEIKRLIAIACIIAFAAGATVMLIFVEAGVIASQVDTHEPLALTVEPTVSQPLDAQWIGPEDNSVQTLQPSAGVYSRFAE